jgi:hypothetical protein
MGSVLSKPTPPQITTMTGANTFGDSVKQIQGTKPITPTTAEVDQATSTEMDAKGIKRRRRGRSPTILTGASGVSEGATLGTPTLLG